MVTTVQMVTMVKWTTFLHCRLRVTDPLDGRPLGSARLGSARLGSARLGSTRLDSTLDSRLAALQFWRDCFALVQARAISYDSPGATARIVRKDE